MCSAVQRESEDRELSSGLSSAPDDAEHCDAVTGTVAPKVGERLATGISPLSPLKRIKKTTTADLEQSSGSGGRSGAKRQRKEKSRTVAKKGKVIIKINSEDNEEEHEKRAEREDDSTELAQVKVVTTNRQRVTTAEKEAGIIENELSAPEPKGVSEKGKKSKKSRAREDALDDRALEDEEPKVGVKRKRKTKEEKEAEAMPLAARTLSSNMLIGAHVSSAGGVHNSVANCVHIGGNAFALFLKSQRKWENLPLREDHINQFHAQCKKHSYAANAHVLPHGSYLVNLAAAEPAKAVQAYNAFLDDVRRCSSLGIRYYNIHPGNTNGLPRADAIGRIAKALNRANAETTGTGVMTLLENMAASPTTSNAIGGAFEDLRDIIALVDDKSRIGVTLDTCHAFAAGFDLRTPEAYADVMSRFDNVIGREYLKAVHVNDSKAPLNSYRDLHQNIGLGFLGLQAFHNLVNDARFVGVPLVLETPIDRVDSTTGKIVEDKVIWAREIKLLESLVGMDTTGEEFKTLMKRLADEGLEERKKYQESHEKKVEREKKKTEKAKASGGAKSKTRKKVKENETDNALSSAEESE